MALWEHQLKLELAPFPNKKYGIPNIALIAKYLK